MRRALLAAACVTALVLQGVTPGDAEIEQSGVVRRLSGRFATVRLASGHPRPSPVDQTPGHRMPVLQGIRVPEKPSPVPSVSYPGGVLSAAEVASYLRQAGFPESAIPTMVGFAYRESHFNPRAVNPSSGACGLLQLYPCPSPAALGPLVNCQLAYLKFVAAGFDPWS